MEHGHLHEHHVPDYFDDDDWEYNNGTTDNMAEFLEPEYTIYMITTIIGITCAMLIFIVIVCNKQMHNKTNVMIANVMILKALALLIKLVTLHLLHSLNESRAFECTFLMLGNCLLFGSYVFVMGLLSNRLMKSTRLGSILIIVYSFILAMYLISWVICENVQVPMLDYPLLILFGMLFVICVFKDMNAVYKQWWRKDPLCDDTSFRLTICRILIYNGLAGPILFEIFVGINDNIFNCLKFLGFLSSLFICIYVFVTRKDYRYAFWRLIPFCLSKKIETNQAIITYENTYNNES